MPEHSTPSRSPSRRIEFRIHNAIRETIFVLTFVLLFALNVWLIPQPYNFIVIAAIILSLPLLILIRAISEMLNQQIYDRIRMTRFCVEYDGGTFSENWQRPYNEFRVEYVVQNWIAFQLHRVRLKHRVLPNVTVKSTFSRSKAEQTVSDLLKNSPLKLLSHDK